MKSSKSFKVKFLLLILTITNFQKMQSSPSELGIVFGMLAIPAAIGLAVTTVLCGTGYGIYKVVDVSINAKNDSDELLINNVNRILAELSRLDLDSNYDLQTKLLKTNELRLKLNSYELKLVNNAKQNKDKADRLNRQIVKLRKRKANFKNKIAKLEKEVSYINDRNELINNVLKKINKPN